MGQISTNLLHLQGMEYSTNYGSKINQFLTLTENGIQYKLWVKDQPISYTCREWNTVKTVGLRSTNLLHLQGMEYSMGQISTNLLHLQGMDYSTNYGPKINQFITLAENGIQYKLWVNNQTIYYTCRGMEKSSNCGSKINQFITLAENGIQ